MTTTRSATRLRRYAREYASEVWGVEIARISADQVLVMEVRADGYANAHVEGGHGSDYPCPAATARECGERQAAAEFVETSTVDDEPKPATNRGDRAPMTHRGHDHANTKAERAKCRRAIYALRAELSVQKEN